MAAISLGILTMLCAPLALAQTPGADWLASPYEAAPLPDELTVIEGLPDPAPRPPAGMAGPGPALGELSPFHDVELTEPPTDSSGGWLRNGLSYIEADVVLLQHNSHNRIDLAEDSSVGVERELQVERGELGLATNMRLTVGQYLMRDDMNRDHAVEFTFYGLGDWTAEGSITAVTNNFLISAIDPFIGGFNGSDQQVFRYQSDLDSYELNYRLSWRLGRDQMILQPGGGWVRKAAPGTLLGLSAGLRVVEIDERFSYSSVSTIPSIRRGRLFISTTNDLVGGQFGGQWMQQFENWNWGVRGKLGAYVNFTSMSSDLFTVDPVFLELDRRDRAEKDVLAFLGELGVFARYHVRPNACLRVGFEAMWLNQVAQATEQIDFTADPTREVEDGAAPFYMGLSCGFEATW